MLEPCTGFLVESGASQGKPSCLASGNVPFAMQSKLQCMTSHMALMVGAPIILASKHVVGILQLEQVELQGKLHVQEFTVLWFILPCTGTPSPKRPTGSMAPCGRPQLSPACQFSGIKSAFFRHGFCPCSWLVQVVTQPFMG